MPIIMTYAEKATSDNCSRNMVHNKTTAVSLHNCLCLLSPLTAQWPPSLDPVLICPINSLARTAGIEFIPWRTCRQTDKNRYHYSCWMPRDTWYGHKRLSQAMSVWPWVWGYSWHRGSLTPTQEQGSQLYMLIPSQNHKAQLEKEEAWGF